VVGRVAQLHASLAWFERRPLFGKQVLITRPPRQGQELADRLEILGARTAYLPAVVIGPPPSWEAVDNAIAHLANYDWLVFTSSNGVRSFLGRLLEGGHDVRLLGSLKLAGIGPSTGAALRDYHLQPDLIPRMYSSEGLAAELLQQVAGKRVLLARADRGREVLRNELARIALVDEMAVYSQTDATQADADVREALKSGGIDFVTVTSSNIARALARQLPPETASHIAAGKLRFVSISPITSAAMREVNLPVATEAADYTMEGVVEALLNLVAKS
jgi:uroporphyrinogen III methyltransferase/synthase